jgi:sugar O-acyltransferase (sialic acid O-acetyltransferase NeuD family)
MNDRSLILIGAGGHAGACIDVIEQQGNYQIAGLIGTPDQLGSMHSGYPVLGTDERLLEFASVYQSALVAVGQIHSPEDRIRLFSEAIKCGFKMPVIIAPDAYVSRSAKVGQGTIVMHGAIINSGAVVGQNCIVNSRALIEHDAVVQDSCHISTGAILNGGVQVGAGSFIGSGSIVKQGIKLGQRCIIGMGCAARNNLADNSTLAGEGHA